MAEIYTTSITVNFKPSDADSKAIFAAEIDSRPKGLNKGESSFVPGVDDPGILLFKSSTVKLLGTETTVGNLSGAGTGTYKVEEYIEFIHEKSASVSKPISGGFTYKWIGKSHGAVSHSENGVSMAKEALGVIKVSYNSSYTAYRLNNVPATVDGETEFPVIAYFDGEE